MSIFELDVRAVIRQHAETLLRKRRRLIVKDDYGGEDRSRWDWELMYFLTNVVGLSSVALEWPAGTGPFVWVDQELDSVELES